MKPEMPLYVRIEEYKEVLDVVNLIRNKILEAKDTLGKVNQLKNEEDIEIERWENALNAVERKMQFIDKALFEPESL